MGFLGMGKDEPEVKPTSALEQARAVREDSGMFAGAVTGLIESLLDVGIDGKGPFDSAQKVADVKRAEKPDAEEAVDAVVRGHLKLAAAGGFVTGLGGFITLPVALPANVVEFYIVATRMVASIASLRGYDIKQPEIRSAVLLTLVGRRRRRPAQEGRCRLDRTAAPTSPPSGCRVRR